MKISVNMYLTIYKGIMGHFMEGDSGNVLCKRSICTKTNYIYRSETIM